MREMLDENLKRFEELEQQLLDPEVLADPNRVAAVSREHGSLARLAGKYRKFQGINAEIADIVMLLEGDDPEIRSLAEAEIPKLKEDREMVWNELLDLTVGGEDANRRRIVMEIRAGTGGDEAALFARDLYEMYKHHCKTWNHHVYIICYR
ncbi:MAG: PCRF domain-containing protein [Pirellulales bacterium]|nr:PCRF domain-containing protein [Pirellulales bacterium]